MKRLNEVELVPFIAAARAGVASMMTSHIVFSPLDNELPATLSPKVLDGLLRQQIGFDGVIFTDDMEMKAIANFFDFDEAIIRTIEAGADVITICHTLEKQHRAIDVIAEAIRSGRLSRRRIALSIERIERLHASYSRSVSFDPEVLNCARHRDLLSSLPDPPLTADPTHFTAH